MEPGCAGYWRVVVGQLDRAGVLLDAMSAIDGQPPGQVRGRAVELLVEEVAPARDALREERAGHDDVERAGERDAATAHEDPDADGGPDDAPVQAQPGIGREDRPEGVGRIELPLPDDVIQAC